MIFDKFFSGFPKKKLLLIIIYSALPRIRNTRANFVGSGNCENY